MLLVLKNGFVDDVSADPSLAGEIKRNRRQMYEDAGEIDPVLEICLIPDGSALSLIPGNPAPTITPEILTATKDLARRRVTVEADRLTDIVTGHVPQAERDSWPTKAAAARAHIASNATADQTAMLNAEAVIRVETITDLANLIIARADEYQVIAAQVAGHRAVAYEAVETATTISEIEAALTAAETAAMALLASIQST
ncbi:MAG: hypothetical protein AAGL24_10100 [Pseudomonadota bacterium]